VPDKPCPADGNRLLFDPLAVVAHHAERTGHLIAGNDEVTKAFDGLGQATAGGEARPAEPLPVPWTSGAEARLANIPEFVRPMARTGIERFAKERGALEVDETILDAAREFFGM